MKTIGYLLVCFIVLAGTLLPVSSMASKDDLEERLLRKIEELRDMLQGEIKGVQGDLVGVQSDITNVKGDITNVQGDITNVQGDITNVQGDITNVKGDIVDMQSANSALCAWQDKVGEGNNGLSGDIIVYDTTYLETNGANCSLDTSTGNFTAGKAGVYRVTVSATIE